METSKSEQPKYIYQIKVTLLETNPPIWRRFEISTECTLMQLHKVIQKVMGWENCHLHEFRLGDRRFGQPDPDLVLSGLQDVENDSKVYLQDVLQTADKKLMYDYDFGDEWEHSVVVEKQLPADPQVTYPVCTDGEIACPPEDCGGVSGFYACADPSHPNHEQMREWLGRDYNPEAFSVERVNKVLARGRRSKSSLTLTPLRARMNVRPKRTMRSKSPSRRNADRP